MFMVGAKNRVGRKTSNTKVFRPNTFTRNSLRMPKICIHFFSKIFLACFASSEFAI